MKLFFELSSSFIISNSTISNIFRSMMMLFSPLNKWIIMKHWYASVQINAYPMCYQRIICNFVQPYWMKYCVLVYVLWTALCFVESLVKILLAQTIIRKNGSRKLERFTNLWRKQRTNLWASFKYVETWTVIVYTIILLAKHF